MIDCQCISLSAHFYSVKHYSIQINVPKNSHNILFYRIKMVQSYSLATFLLLFLLSQFSLNSSQRVAPGVPPKSYHQPPSSPTGNNQQQGYRGNAGSNYVQDSNAPKVYSSGDSQDNYPPPSVLLDASNLEAEREHIQEHMEIPMDTSKMSTEELTFHYFKMNDLDKDGKLDGLELVKSVVHWKDHDHNDNEPPRPLKIFTDEELSQIVDQLMDTNDSNKDGLIDYAEFSIVQANLRRR